MKIVWFLFNFKLYNIIYCGRLYKFN